MTRNNNRVCCLYRVSTDKQVDFNSNHEADLPMQRKACHKFAESKGWVIVHEEQEEGVSGHKVRAAARDKLRAYGIAPPGATQPHQPITLRFMPRDQYQQQRAGGAAEVSCPRCGSAQTERLSAYGSTACKALYRCVSCHEPFEYFKPI